MRTFDKAIMIRGQKVDACKKFFNFVGLEKLGLVERLNEDASDHLEITDVALFSVQQLLTC